MGGRGMIVKEVIPEGRWKWLREVETGRLENYIKRSRFLGEKSDPQGRSIHDVAFYAQKELIRRKS